MGYLCWAPLLVPTQVDMVLTMDVLLLETTRPRQGRLHGLTLTAWLHRLVIRRV